MSGPKLDENQLDKLCIRLLHSEKETEVIEILKEFGLWKNQNFWRLYGDRENNFSTIGNQQSRADYALVEKIINSVDAMILREAKIRNITPDSPDAPKSIKEALIQFFNMNNGKISDLPTSKQKILAQNIILVASGRKSIPSITLIDKGEGQLPEDFPDTFLSLDKSNKVKIPYVQGKFNMGSTGALQFCGENSIQLIISKKYPELANNSDNKEKWGFTIIRRFDPVGNEKTSTYKYLVIDEEVPSFTSNSIRALPEQGNMKNYHGEIESGTIVKMYDYHLPGNIKSQVRTHLYSRLNVLLPEIALPMRIYERRDYERSENPRNFVGLKITLEDTRASDRLEHEYISSGSIPVQNTNIPISIYPFKPDEKTTYYSTEAFILSVNGQAHGTLSKSILEKANLSYIADSLIAILDMSNLDRRSQEQLFMNSRDRLRDSSIKRELVKELTRYLREDNGLKKLQSNRRAEKLKKKTEDQTTLTEALQKVITHSRTLTSVLTQGEVLRNPVDLREGGSAESFDGKYFPTYFELEKEYPEHQPRTGQKGRRIRIFYKTDVQNDYFSRNRHPGTFGLTLIKSNHDVEYTNYSIRLYNGRATLTITLPDDTKIGKKFHFKSKVSHDDSLIPFINEFYVEIKPYKKSKSSDSKRKSPAGDNEDSNKILDQLNLPNVNEVKKQDWGEHGFDESSGIYAIEDGNGSYDYYINMHNVYLLNELKNLKDLEIEEIKEYYKVSMVLTTMGIVNHFHSQKQTEEQDPEDTISIKEETMWISRAIAPVVVPFIQSVRSGII